MFHQYHFISQFFSARSSLITIWITIWITIKKHHESRAHKKSPFPFCARWTTVRSTPSIRRNRTPSSKRDPGRRRLSGGPGMVKPEVTQKDHRNHYEGRCFPSWIEIINSLSMFFCQCVCVCLFWVFKTTLGQFLEEKSTRVTALQLREPWSCGFWYWIYLFSYKIIQASSEHENSCGCMFCLCPSNIQHCFSVVQRSEDVNFFKSVRMSAIVTGLFALTTSPSTWRFPIGSVTQHTIFAQLPQPFSPLQASKEANYKVVPPVRCLPVDFRPWVRQSLT